MVRGRRIGASGMVKAPRPIPDAVRATQARASNPASSSFVSANAGSGKTHVLVQRVIRLLLDGVPPEKILCITFTKAAAANMAERVFTTLGHWVTLDDAALDDAIRGVGIPHPNASLRRAARELFARALETPGGLKVQTIHALCTRLLQQFPFEANVPARFAVLDDRDQNDMMERANLKVFLEASRSPDSAIGRALQTAMASAADVTFKDVVREACLSPRSLHGLDRRDRRRGGRGGAGVGRARRQRDGPDRGCRAGNSRRPLPAAAAMAGDRGSAGGRQQVRSANRRTGCARPWPSPAASRSTNISASSSPTSSTPRKAGAHQEIRATTIRPSRGCSRTEASASRR